MNQNFDKCMEMLVPQKGGYFNHPSFQNVNLLETVP